MKNPASTTPTGRYRINEAAHEDQAAVIPEETTSPNPLSLPNDVSIPCHMDGETVELLMQDKIETGG